MHRVSFNTEMQLTLSEIRNVGRIVHNLLATVPLTVTSAFAAWDKAISISSDPI
jgi:hypothetical protein